FAHILRPRKFLQSRSESYNKGFHGRISLGFGHPSAILYLLSNQYLKAVAKLNQCHSAKGWKNNRQSALSRPAGTLQRLLTRDNIPLRS
ncbi:hypothetical protein, partial [uncultured Thiodictyon sp.]|uniref:hypothetical protein n=1 Tax=uncultured Thiodictyon sp. TaxID=1846217 RepID=UPI0025DF929A